MQRETSGKGTEIENIAILKSSPQKLPAYAMYLPTFSRIPFNSKWKGGRKLFQLRRSWPLWAKNLSLFFSLYAVANVARHTYAKIDESTRCRVQVWYVSNIRFNTNVECNWKLTATPKAMWILVDEIVVLGSSRQAFSNSKIVILGRLQEAIFFLWKYILKRLTNLQILCGV